VGPEAKSDSVSKTDRPIPQTPNEARDAVLARWGRGAQQQPVTTPVKPRPPAPPLSTQGRRIVQGWHWPLAFALLIYVSLCIAFKALAVYSLYLLILYLAYKLLGLGMHGVAWALGRLWQTDRGKRAIEIMFKAFVAAIVTGAAIMAIGEWRITVVIIGAVVVMSGIQLSWALLARSAIWKRFLRSRFVAGISSMGNRK
jgi:hypothetical protein